MRRAFVVAAMVATVLFPVVTRELPRARAEAWVDCTYNPATTCGTNPIAISGDSPAPWYLEAPAPPNTPNPGRGYADPSIRKDPNGLTWMAYSAPHGYWDPTANGGAGGAGIQVDSRIAWLSGSTWLRTANSLWAANARTYPTVAAPPALAGQNGFMNHETVSLAPRNRGGGITTWYGVHDEYWTSVDEGFQIRSYRLRLARASDPRDLDTAPASSTAIMGGAGVGAEWRDASNPDRIEKDLTTDFDDGTELDACHFLQEPALYFDDNAGTVNDYLYLAMTCRSYIGSTENTEGHFVALWRTKAPDTDPSTWVWDYPGKLLDNQTHDDAYRLGEVIDGHIQPGVDNFSASVILQNDIAKTASGSIVLVVTPASPPPPALDNHYGCVAVKITNIQSQPPTVQRGATAPFPPVPLAAVTASDELDTGGPGACAYEPTVAATGGMMFTRREAALPGLYVSLHKTGLAPA